LTVDILSITVYCITLFTSMLPENYFFSCL